MRRPSIPRPDLSLHGGVDAEALIGARPKAVIDLLADPDSVSDWFPIGVEVDGRKPRRWRAGSAFTVVVVVAGERVRMAVTVQRLDAEGLEFDAKGAVEIHGVATFESAKLAHTRMQARVHVVGHGLAGEVIAGAALGLLRGGALDRALHVVKREVERAER